MKKSILAIFIVSILFSSCTKKEEDIKPDISAYNVCQKDGEYRIDNPDWDIVSNDYQHEDFDIAGRLYMNADNPIETYFDTKSSTVKWDGTYKKVVTPGETISYECNEPAKDCKWNMQYNAEGVITGAQIVVKSHIGIIFDPEWSLVNANYYDRALQVYGALYQNDNDEDEYLFEVKEKYFTKVKWTGTYTSEPSSTGSEKITCQEPARDCKISLSATGVTIVKKEGK